MSCFPDWRNSMIVNRHLIIWFPCGGQFSGSTFEYNSQEPSPCGCNGKCDPISPSSAGTSGYWDLRTAVGPECSLSVVGVLHLAVVQPAFVSWKGRTGSVRNSTLHLPGPGYRSNFQSSQAEAVIKPRGSVEGELGHLFTPLKHKHFQIYT